MPDKTHLLCERINIMASIVYLNSPDGIHNTYGLSIMTDTKEIALDFRYHVLSICNSLKCHYFLQGEDLNDNSTNWIYIEFFGEGDEDKILKVVSEYQRIYKKEVMMEVPSRELLTSLKLF